MSTSASPSQLSVIITRLRAAGCVFAEDEAALLAAAAQTPADLAAMVGQRADGLPLEHVLGWSEFCGLRIAVDSGVFVPRRRTEFLAGQAIDLARRAGGGARPPVVLDLCCGAGALGAAVAAALGRVELHAADIDPAAARCARRNLAPVGGHVHEGDLYQPLPAALRGRVDVLVANVPYVPTEEVGLLPPEARLHEPRAALDGGVDGLDIARRVAAGAPRWLAPGGCLLIETSIRQLAPAVEAFSGAGLLPRAARSEELDVAVVIGAAPAGEPGVA